MPAQPPPASRVPSIPPGIIDSGVCLPAVRGRLQPAAWRRAARGHGMVHAVAAPSGAGVAVDNAAANRRMAQLVRARGSRLSGLAVANPWFGCRAVAMLERAFRDGLVGLYLEPALQGFKLGDALLDPLIAVCARWRRPVYCHTGTPVCAMPFQLAELARRFPAVSFVMGHAAWSDFSGYDLIPAARQAPNILVETSCTAAAVIQAAADALGPKRLLFGSGFPASFPACELEKFKALRLDAAARELILRRNALRLWNLADAPCAS